VSCPFEAEVLLLNDGELPSERRYVVEAHLAVCPACAATEAALDLVEQTVRAEPERPLGVVTKTLGSLEPRHSWRPAVAAAAVLVAGTLAVQLSMRGDSEPVPIVKLAPPPSDDLPLPRAPSMEALRDLLISAESRRVIASRFRAAGARGESALAHLITDEDDAVRRRALAVASYSPSVLYVEPAAALLSDDTHAPHAARLLGQIGSDRAVPALDGALDGSAAIEAREALVAIGGDAAAAVLARRARQTDDAELLDALARTAPKRAARLLAAEADVRAARVRTVLDRRRTQLLPELRRAAKGNDPRLASDAARLLGWAKDEASIDTLRGLTRDLKTRRAATAALVAVGTTAALEYAFATCYRAGGDATLAVLFQGAKHAEEFLLERLSQGTVAEKKVVLELLAHCGGAATLDALESGSWPGGLVHAALRTAGTVGGARAVAFIVRWRDRPSLRGDVIAALGETRDGSAVPVLREFAENRRLAAPAAEALGKVATPDSARALVELLVRETSAPESARALARMPASIVVPVLLEALSRERVAIRVREVLVRMAGVDLGKEPEDWRRWWATRS
jgi:HEAT repeat protein